VSQITEDDLLDAQDVYKVFKTITPEWKPYCSSEELEAANMEALCGWGRENLTGGLRAFGLLGGWQISFQECVRQNLLEADERVAETQAKAAAIKDAAAFRVRVQKMSAGQMKEASRTEPDFLQKYEALTKSTKVRIY
jgi:hypothetical protein